MVLMASLILFSSSALSLYCWSKYVQSFMGQTLMAFIVYILPVAVVVVSSVVLLHNCP